MLPPVTEVGFNTIAVTFGGLTVNVAPVVLEPALIEIVVTTATGFVAMVNVPVVLPPAMTHAAGLATPLLLAIGTVHPAAGAGEARVSVPVDFSPPISAAGLSVIDLNAGGLIVNGALMLVPLTEILTAVIAATGTVETVNLAVVDPAGTVQDTTLAAALLLARAIVVPAVGAAPVSVSVPVEAVPPVTVTGLSAMLFADGGTMVRVEAIVVPLTVIVAGVEIATGVVVIVNVPVSAPSVKTHAAGLAAGLLLTRSRVNPAGAGEPNVTVPRALTPPMTLAGTIVTPAATGGLILSVAPIVVPFAVMATDVSAATGLVFTTNVPVFAPPGMVQAAAEAMALLLVNVIV